MKNADVSRDELTLDFLDLLPYAPYPVQEEAIYKWFDSDTGVMVCAPTGTGKTVIAQAAIYEALRTGKTVYYTTPLIALTEQKFREVQDIAEKWGFAREQIGLVTGNRRVNPQATVLVVVAEILLNRLLNLHWAAHVESQSAAAAESTGGQFAAHTSAAPDSAPTPTPEPPPPARVAVEDDLIGWEEPVDAPAAPATVATSSTLPVTEAPAPGQPLSRTLDFDHVSAIVMDEFHYFSDPERGIVWEFTLALMPSHIRLLLLSATIGNAPDFVIWCARTHHRRLELIQSSDRQVALQFRWVADKLLTEHLEEMAAGDETDRRTPALVFAFNRDLCWSIAEELKGRSMLADGQQKRLVAELEKLDWSRGVGPKLKQLLMRGVGVHHAGILPKYKRIVEELFQKKLLTICVCTETLAAGINLPARSVVLPSLMKGKPGEQKLIDPSSAHQIFGRAGRPQFDKEGFVYVLAHEDDVRILRWRQQYDQIPEDTKDPLLIRAKKALKKKMPTRSPERQYWNEQQFEKLRLAKPGDLVSRGPIPWRLLAYMLQVSPEVAHLRTLIHKRLLDPKHLEANEKQLERMLRTLHAADLVRLDPPPPAPVTPDSPQTPAEEAPPAVSWLSQQLQAQIDKRYEERTGKSLDKPAPSTRYQPVFAYPTEQLSQLFIFRSVNPLFGLYLTQLLGEADRVERLLLLESVLEFPRNLLRTVRVPPPHKLPPGPLARNRVDQELIQRGLIAAPDLYPEFDPDVPFEERKYAPALADKVRMLFAADYPDVTDVDVQPVMVATDLLENWGDNFWNFVSGRDLTKQEGLIFRHLLRMVLMLGEFRQVTPPGLSTAEWQSELREISERLTACCRAVDPNSTDLMLADDHESDFVEPSGIPTH